MVRITDMQGEWKFTPIQDGIVTIEYSLRLDPAGSVPDWITNLFIDNGPYHSMLKFKEMLKLERHQKATFKFIDEFK